VKHDGPDEALAAYAELVRRWAPRLDLVAPGDLASFEERHVADSLRARPVVDSAPEGPAVDVGSGAGLPGIPLALTARPRPWRLLEPRRRRAAFLEECVRELGLQCEVLTLTAEEAARDPALRGGHGCALARALAPPPRAFALLDPLLDPCGVAVVWVGDTALIPAGAERWKRGIAIMRSEGRHPSP
jgi:16S rRNA (guanine527-N7)-methyltransferase